MEEKIVESMLKQHPNIDYNYVASGCAWYAGVPVLLLLVALLSMEGPMSKSPLASFWAVVSPYLIGLCVLVLVPCVAVIGWRMYKVKKLHDHDEEQRWHEQKLLKERVKLSQQANQLVQESRANGDNIKLQFGDDGSLRSLEIIRSNMAQQQRVRVTEKPVERIGGAMPALPAPSSDVAQQEDETPIPLPQAPDFWDIVELITAERMPLCFVVDTNPESPTYMQTVPAFGTILDLLSLCIIGKPGRGKSVLLLFYICILAKYGGEMHVLDPQGAFKELMLLHGKVLPSMPETARIYYYSDLEEMEVAVSDILGEIKVRERLYKPHLVDGELQLHTLKHPLIIMADELPIIAEMDLEIKQRMKEENKQRKEDGLDQLKIMQVTQLVKTAVLAARKYGVYFLGASQSIDATILPTRVSAGFNSRIVFYSELQKARMAGLESEVGKRLLPVIRRAGPGASIYDCGRWDEPLVAAFPYVTIEDVLLFFGIDMEELKALWIAELSGEEEQTVVRSTGPLAVQPQVKTMVKRATLADAVEVWNEQEREIGRPRLQELLQQRGLACSDDLAKTLLKRIKQQLPKSGGGGEN